MLPILIWWIGTGASPPPAMLEMVRAHTERALGMPVRLWSGADRPSGTLDARRGQHSSSAILAWLREQRPPALRTIAVTDVDLFVPVLTFVYGEAQLNGEVAVVSTARLGSASPPDGPRLLTVRLAKEVVHELGHTFGLVHCDSTRCVMSRSNSIAAIDAKAGTFCSSCGLLLVEPAPRHTEALS